VTSPIPSFARIAAGSFDMGDEDGRDDERPVHRVTLSAFEIARRQVTNEEYDRFVAAAGHSPAPHRLDPPFADPRQPVVAVSWFDAVDYCAWLSELTARRVRLPSEAEWEFAARAGSNTRYPWGNDEARDGDASRWIEGPEPCGAGTPNAFGLHDFCENVHEWCSDWYQAGYYAQSPDRDPHGPEVGVRRVSRGGSWRHRVKVSRSAARSSLPPDLRYNDYGFRIARDAE
jgi:formylglycine-generating enzyme required for sulfatase activity